MKLVPKRKLALAELPKSSTADSIKYTSETSRRTLNVLDASKSNRSAYQSAKLDLSGAATDNETFIATKNCRLAGYKISYTEASSADAGVAIRIGRYQDGVALDNDYFDTSTSEVSKALGYTKTMEIGDLTQYAIFKGDTVTTGTAGGKVGTGEVIVTLQIAELAG